MRAIVKPGEVALGPITVLMVVDDVDSLTGDEQSRVDLIEGWGWTVELIAANANLDAFNTAMADGAHVLYVPDDGGSASVGTVLKDFTHGIVFEDGDMNATLGLSTGSASYLSTAIDVVDNSHYITSAFPIGDLTIASTSGSIEYPAGTVAGSVRPLAWRPATEYRVVGTVDVGQTLQDGSTAAGRRATGPFAGFAADELTDDGKLLLKRMLEWSAQSAMSHDAVEAITDWTTSSSLTAPDGEDRLLVVTVGAETHSTVTSVTYGGQPLTLAGSAYESTGVGARVYVYYAREVSIAAASGSSINVSWSGGGDDKCIASRMYQYVNQADPIRTSNTNSNAGPPSISTEPMSVSNGDMVIGTAQVGHNHSYSWSSPMVMGVNDVNSTSTHTAADYAVTGDPGTVTATATVSNPNRQALVGVVIQPRSQASGEGVIPQLLALYEFDEDLPTPELMGHWKLDDDDRGGALAIDDDVRLDDDSYIDGYHGSAGAYGGGNQHESVILVTNTSNSGSIDVNNNAKIWGHTYNAPGANPTNVVSISSGAEITGNRYEQSVGFDLPSNTAPGGSWPNDLNDKTYSSTTTIAVDTRFGDLTVNNGATINIVGDVRIWVDDDFRMYGGQFVVGSGSSLTLYVDDDFLMENSSKINDDTQGAGRVTIYHYNDEDDAVFSMSDNARICGTVHVKRDLEMEDDAEIYGAVYVDDDLRLEDDAAIHIDLDLPGFHIVPIIDETGTNESLAQGGVSFDQSGEFGSSFYFDGDDDFVLIPHHDDYLLHHGTVSFWFYSDSLSGQRALFSKDSSGDDSGGHLHIWTDGSTLKARIQTDGSSPYGTGNSFEVSDGGLKTGRWYHVAVTFGAGGLNLYVNANLQDTADYPGGLATSSGGIGNYEPLVLGAGTTGSGDLTHLSLSDHFQGRIDDVRIYKEVLDVGQVRDLKLGHTMGDRTAAGYNVRDTSGLGDPLDLFVENTDAVDWETGGGLTFDAGTVLRAPSPPTKIRNGITATGEFSLEFIIEPSQVDATGRRLFWYGPNSGSDTNLDVRMQSGSHVVRLRNEDTGNNPPDITTSTGLAADTEYHVLVTFDGEYVRVYRDGVMVVESEQPGHMLSWDADYGFTLGNLPDGSAPWLGTIKRMAVYDRAMNQRQTDNLVEGLPPGDGASTGVGGFSVRWREGY